MRATDPDEAIGRNVKRLRVKCGRTIDDVVKAMQKAAAPSSPMYSARSSLLNQTSLIFAP